MAKPVAVLIADIHYEMKSLKVADSCMRKAIKTAEELDVPLFVAGDLHETKANLRGECANAMIETFSQTSCAIELIIGNHDKINEKSQEHSLNFLEPYCDHIITEPQKFSFDSDDGFKFYVIPYYHDVDALRAYLKTIPKGSTLIMHQGLNGSQAGEYFNDKSALNKEDVEDFRVISGHYHYRQDIKTGRPRKGAVGLWSFIGNPYTQSFNECRDPEKGYQILFDDGTLEFVPTHERKHVRVKIEYRPDGVKFVSQKYESADLLWVTVSGPSDWLAKSVNKQTVRDMIGVDNFRLETVSTDEIIQGDLPEKLNFDDVIDTAKIDTARKPRLKTLWKDLIDEDTASRNN